MIAVWEDTTYFKAMAIKHASAIADGKSIILSGFVLTPVCLPPSDNYRYIKEFELAPTIWVYVWQQKGKVRNA
jgi:hypothetical protein